MRLKISLISSTGKLPINYNYPLASAIYNLLRFGSEEFATFLHDNGFQLNGKKYKLFTFSLSIKQFRIEKDFFILLNPELELFISSPKIDDFINNFVLGSFEKQEIIIHNNFVNYKFSINQIESLPSLVFSELMKFKILSPLVLSTKVDTVQGVQVHYLRYDDDLNEINRILSQNLRNKYFLLTNQQDTSDDLRLEWDNDYVRRQLKAGKKLSSKITIDNSHTKIDVVGIKALFTLSGNKELIKTGYECGFGEKNSMGFGMVEEIIN